MKVNLGYFVDEDKVDSIFLDDFHYSRVSDTEDMKRQIGGLIFVNNCLFDKMIVENI
jgi:hypothetical protein